MANQSVAVNFQNQRVYDLFSNNHNCWLSLSWNVPLVKAIYFPEATNNILKTSFSICNSEYELYWEAGKVTTLESTVSSKAICPVHS